MANNQNLKRPAGRPAGPIIKPPPAVRTSEERASAQRKRPLFGVRTSKMDVDYEIPGYQLAYITDYDDGRLTYALECGYTFVEKSEISFSGHHSDVVEGKDEANRVSMYAGQSESNKPMRTFLMKIPKEYYEEAQQVIREQADRQESQLYSGDQSQVQGKYIPTSIETKIGHKIV